MNNSSVHSPTSTFSVSAIVEKISNGTLKVPQFQRDFVWTLLQAASLLDSILKRYPIGSLILWETNEKLHAERKIGGLSLSPTPSGQRPTYVLDGQQRVTAVFAALQGLTIEIKGKKTDFSTLVIDFTAKSGEKWVVIDNSAFKGDEKVRLRDLFDGNFKGLRPDFIERASQFHQQLHEEKDLSAITLTNAPTEKATEVFERINTHGKKLTVFDVMVAKTFGGNSGFDLGERFRVLDADFRRANFGISESVVLQAACAIITGKEPSRKNIFAINRKTFADNWPRVEKALRAATDYLHNTIGVPNSRLLPYEALVVAFAFVFDRVDCKPNSQQKKWLQHYFWSASLGDRYEAHVESTLAEDLKQLQKVVDNEPPVFDFHVYCAWDDIRDYGNFRLNSAYIKALICLMHQASPRSFINGEKVVIDDVLHKGNSKNYHHFFPRAYLKEIGNDNPDHIANITLLRAAQNQSLGDRSPKAYIPRYKSDAVTIETTLKSQFIDAKKQDAWIDNYSNFKEMRCRMLASAIKAKLVTKEMMK